MNRPDCIVHYLDIQKPDTTYHAGSSELLSIGSPFGAHFGLRRIGIHHEALPPGRRSSWPHCESTEDEFVYVVEGTPDVWLDGHLHRLQPGDAVGFPAGTGIAHAFLNNSQGGVRLLAVGDVTRDDNRVHYPIHPEINARLGARHWSDAPRRELGPHDGLPDALRGRPAPCSTAPRPACIVHRNEIQQADDAHYPGSAEPLSVGSPFGAHFGLQRIGIHHEALPPGRRTSWPHCESTEDEFVYVLEGTPDVWLDGRLYRLQPGDAVGFPAGSGLAHSFLNNTDAPVRLICVGDRNRADNQVHYPLHPHRNAEIGALHWADAPRGEQGPHDGLPDALRAAPVDHFQ